MNVLLVSDNHVLGFSSGNAAKKSLHDIPVSSQL